MLVKVVAFDGKHKIADHWEDHPYIVISQPNPNIPVYKVSREDGERRCKNTASEPPSSHWNQVTISSTSANNKIQSEAERERERDRSMDKAESESPPLRDDDSDDDESVFFSWVPVPGLPKTM